MDLIDENFYLFIHNILFFFRFAIMDHKVCHHGSQVMPSWTSTYATMDFKVCHHGLQGMPPWTSRYATTDF